MADLEISETVTAARRAFPRFDLEVISETESTQDLVRAAALAGAPEGVCRRAEFQRAGRGRQGRDWVAPPGSALLFSLLLRPTAAVLPGVSLAAGLAVSDAVATRAGVSCGLKWPNDVLVDGRKLAGILVEIEARAEQATVLGVGLNLAVYEFPADVPGVSLHTLTATHPGPNAMLLAIVLALRDRLDRLSDGGIAALRRDWLARAVGIGGPVRARNGDTAIAGTAVDIDNDGALLVATRDGIRRLVAGEVHLGP